jgi:hypothetical protein
MQIRRLSRISPMSSRPSRQAKFDTFSSKLAAIDSLGKQMKAMDAKMSSLEGKLAGVLYENKVLKADNKAKDKII